MGGFLYIKIPAEVNLIEKDIVKISLMNLLLEKFYYFFLMSYFFKRMNIYNYKV